MVSVEFQKLKDINYLSKYEPNFIAYIHYAKDNPSLIAAAHKVVDTYQCICRARSMLFIFTELG